MSKFEERRRYFRVEDKIELAFRVLNEDDQYDPILSQQQALSESYAELENQIQLANQNVIKKWPEAAGLFDLLNRKINLMMRASGDFGSATGDLPFKQAVNLSACGIAFCSNEPLALGTRLLLRMKLKPGNHSIAVISFVMGCDISKDETQPDAFLVRADFSGISDDHQELLIQHVMLCQTRHLRERRGTGAYGS